MLDSRFANYYVLNPYSSFNTFTYISVLFKDFGYWGSCLGSLMLGFFVRKVYQAFKKTKSPFYVACYALTACAVFEMFFSNHFLSQSYPFTILLLMVLYNKSLKMDSISVLGKIYSNLFESKTIGLKASIINYDSLIGSFLNSNEIHKLILKLKNESGMSFVIVTHNPNLVALADKLYEIKDGQISLKN